MRFGIYERLETGRNLGLDVPEEGHGTIASTIFSFGLNSETRTQTFDFDATTALRFSNLPDEGSETDFGDTRLLFDYAREAANAGMLLEADYLGYDIGFLRSLSDFVDDEGVIDLPPDFADLTGDGTRREYDLRAAFDFGRQNLIGYNFFVGVNRLSYSDTTDPGLFDEETIEAGVGMTFSLSPRTEARLDYSFEHNDRDDTDQTTEDRDDLIFGLTHEASSRTILDASFGYSKIDESGLSGDDITEGYVGSLGLVYAMPNGDLTADLDSSLETEGRLDTLTVGRSLEIPNGAFSASVGGARVPGGEKGWIGSLSYEQERGPNEVFAQLRRDVSTNAERELRFVTVADIGYVRLLTPNSRIGLGAIYALTEETSTDPRTEYTELSAVYSHRLTEYWNFNTGVNYRVRDEEGLGEATSPLVFFQIGRDFVWRP
ncbi:hypothetical protein J7394_21265 [Ruegeria sp. R13_0]|uniref:hypothetical protein n=1 Tax=Ruegeria sp. R13_0 TaxID=2821099 RepID=UPI001ADC3ADE|nr:hypothetical protein [Ruegeria sp. R13_0]MBO9436746.1 hypothetical protein [Ruegeria sp. R13_0]